jgi:parallel beta-helix repeat protein
VTVYYVATNGSDSDDGSATSPWRTISTAMKAKLEPGDEVVVKSGTYNEAVLVTKDGAADNPITIRSEVQGGAKIVPTGDKPGILVSGDHVTVDGFDVSGSKGSGITATGVHHLTITDNIVHDNVSNGIFVGKSDFITVEDNVVFGNAAKGGASGIHLKGSHAMTGSDSDDYRIIVRGNVSYENERKYGSVKDGNGISLDDFNNTQIPSLPPYEFKSLVEDNIVFSNTGRGVQIHRSDYVTVRDNVSMDNNADGRSGPWQGEIVNMGSSNNTWTGNIAVTDPGNPAIGNLTFDGEATNANVSWHDNVTFNGTPGDASVYSNAGGSKPTAADGNLLGHDPKLTLADLKAPLQDLLTHGSSEIPAVGVEDPGEIPSGLTLNGDAVDNQLSGGAGSDNLSGNDGPDRLMGDDGGDRLAGGNGLDTMLGGADDDVFVYRHTSDAIQDDVISDFSDGDLSAIDANAKAAANPALTFGARGSAGEPGESRYFEDTVEIANGDEFVSGDFIL